MKVINGDEFEPVSDEMFIEEYHNMPFYGHVYEIEGSRIDAALSRIKGVVKNIHGYVERYVSKETYDALIEIYADLGSNRPICGSHIHMEFEVMGSLLELLNLHEELWSMPGEFSDFERELFNLTTEILIDTYFERYMNKGITEERIERMAKCEGFDIS